MAASGQSAHCRARSSAGALRHFQPALGGDAAVAGVDAEGDAGRGSAGTALRHQAGSCRARVPRMTRVDAPAERLVDVGLGAEAAAELARHAGRRDDGADAVAVDRPALAGAVEIDEVQERARPARPSAGPWRPGRRRRRFPGRNRPAAAARTGRRAGRWPGGSARGTPCLDTLPATRHRFPRHFRRPRTELQAPVKICGRSGEGRPRFSPSFHSNGAHCPIG